MNAAEAYVDPARSERIVESLLVSAVHHAPPVTPVWLTVRWSRAGGVLVAMDDTGPGVPDDLKANVFESFVQGHVREHSPGLGLGLTLVSRFAALHGGRAWVEDRPGGGAAFRAWPPAADDPSLDADPRDANEEEAS